MIYIDLRSNFFIDLNIKLQSQAMVEPSIFSTGRSLMTQDDVCDTSDDKGFKFKLRLLEIIAEV